MRKLSGFIMLLLLSVVLVACGSEDEEDPTPEPTAAVESEPTEDASVELPGTPEFEVDEEATPDTGAIATPAADAATPDAAMGTPAVAVADAATPEASPVIEATPVAAIEASPMATPQGSASPVATPEATPGATPEDAAAGQSSLIAPVAGETETPAVMVELTGMVVLNGVENQAYILTNEGCVGLGQHGDLREGRQVVVRDEAGTIVSVTELTASANGEGCVWEFVAQAPESNFYSVSIPMKLEHVFPKAQVNANGGELVIELP